MSKVYMVNVGANMGDAGMARSPVFPDRSFVFVTFPDPESCAEYPAACRPYVREVTTTHADPDWDNLTYGDICNNGRARALLSVVPGDILLFWGLLWRTTDANQSVWSVSDRGWYLLGSLQVRIVLEAGTLLSTLPPEEATRAASNAHVVGGRVDPDAMTRIFLADRAASGRFQKAVDLEIGLDGGLMHRVFRTAGGELVRWKESPKWSSVFRSCRAVLDTTNPSDRVRLDDLKASMAKCNTLHSI